MRLLNHFVIIPSQTFTYVNTATVTSACSRGTTVTRTSCSLTCAGDDLIWAQAVENWGQSF